MLGNGLICGILTFSLFYISGSNAPDQLAGSHSIPTELYDEFGCSSKECVGIKGTFKLKSGYNSMFFKSTAPPLKTGATLYQLSQKDGYSLMMSKDYDFYKVHEKFLIKNGAAPENYLSFFKGNIDPTPVKTQHVSTFDSSNLVQNSEPPSFVPLQNTGPGLENFDDENEVSVEEEELEGGGEEEEEEEEDKEEISTSTDSNYEIPLQPSNIEIDSSNTASRTDSPQKELNLGLKVDISLQPVIDATENPQSVQIQKNAPTVSSENSKGADIADSAAAEDISEIKSAANSSYVKLTNDPNQAKQKLGDPVKNKSDQVNQTAADQDKAGMDKVSQSVTDQVNETKANSGKNKVNQSETDEVNGTKTVQDKVEMIKVNQSEIDGVKDESYPVKNETAEVKDGADEVKDGADLVNNGTDAVKDGADLVNNGTDAIKDGADLVNNGTDAVKDGADLVNNGTDAVKDGADLVNNRTDEQKDAASKVKNGTDKVKDGADLVNNGTDEVKDEVVQVNNRTDELKDATGEVKNGTDKVKDGAGQVNNRTDEIKDAADEVKNGTDKVKDGAGQVNNRTDEIKDAADEVKNGTDKVKDGAGQVNNRTDEIKDAADEVKSGAGQVKNETHELKAAADQINKTDANQTNSLGRSNEEIETVGNKTLKDIKIVNQQITKVQTNIETIKTLNQEPGHLLNTPHLKPMPEIQQRDGSNGPSTVQPYTLKDHNIDNKELNNEKHATKHESNIINPIQEPSERSISQKIWDDLRNFVNLPYDNNDKDMFGPFSNYPSLIILFNVVLFLLFLFILNCLNTQKCNNAIKGKLYMCEKKLLEQNIEKVKIQELVSENNAAAVSFEKLKEENELSRLQICELTSKVEELNNNEKLLHDNVNEYKSKFEALEELSNKKNIKKNYEKLMDQVKVQKDKLNELATGMEERAEALRNEKENIESLLKVQAEEHAKVVNDYRMLLNNLELENTELREIVQTVSVDSDVGARLLEAVKLQVRLSDLEKENVNLNHQLEGEREAHKLLEDHQRMTQKEVNDLRESYELVVKEKTDVSNQLKYITDYFQKLGEELKKEIADKDILLREKHGDDDGLAKALLNLRKENCVLNEENNILRDKYESLKVELTDQKNEEKLSKTKLESEREQIWMNWRAAERKIESLNLDNKVLRSKLVAMGSKSETSFREMHTQTYEDPDKMLSPTSSLFLDHASPVPQPSYFYAIPPPPLSDDDLRHMYNENGYHSDADDHRYDHRLPPLGGTFSPPTLDNIPVPNIPPPLDNSQLWRQQAWNSQDVSSNEEEQPSAFSRRRTGDSVSSIASSKRSFV